MSEITYHGIVGESRQFAVGTSDANEIVSIVNPQDEYRMNWVRDNNVWGRIKSDYQLDVDVRREFTDQGHLLETYTFTNNTAFDIYTMPKHLGIYVPLPDYYTKASVGLTKCCSAHIWCGENSSYVMALRQGGEAPHLGLVLKEGALQGYSVERGYDFSGREEEVSNNRGLFILHPENLVLHPAESYTLSWELQWFDDKEAFRAILNHTKNFINVESDAFVVLDQQPVRFQVHVGSDDLDDQPTEVTIAVNGDTRTVTAQDHVADVDEGVLQPGEYRYTITWNGQTTHADFLVVPNLRQLAERRVNFIVDKQQCNDPDSVLDGAYLIYDNEDRRQYYSHRNDYNGGRERVGMAVLVAYYLRKHPNERIHASLTKYVQYLATQLFNEEDGTVYNDAPRNNDAPRLYNYPWVGQLFLELYALEGEARYLDWYYKAIRHFYEIGGGHFYAIGLPMYESIQIFRGAGRDEQADELLGLYKQHADFIAERGRNYPEHEVSYEQSIVGPAAMYLAEVYRLTHEDKYREAFLLQLESLDLFEGFQPDYHMNEVAIRHWDGYWFGKKKMLGDTFPHYWTALSGLSFARFEEAFGTDEYAVKAKKALRSVLSLFNADGSASCAMVYPMYVNDREAHMHDPWANDQDWGLYYVLKYNEF